MPMTVRSAFQPNPETAEHAARRTTRNRIHWPQHTAAGSTPTLLVVLRRQRKRGQAVRGDKLPVVDISVWAPPER